MAASSVQAAFSALISAIVPSAAIAAAAALWASSKENAPYAAAPDASKPTPQPHFAWGFFMQSKK
jgi:hypothetical protein